MRMKQLKKNQLETAGFTTGIPDESMNGWMDGGVMEGWIHDCPQRDEHEGGTFNVITSHHH